MSEVNQQLLAACKAQHQAIDMLFAMLIAKTMNNEKPFYPSESGQPWTALLLGRSAIDAAEKQQEPEEPM